MGKIPKRENKNGKRRVAERKEARDIKISLKIAAEDERNEAKKDNTHDNSPLYYIVLIKKLFLKKSLKNQISR